MSVLSQETRLVGAGAALLPRVNLLPPEIAEKAAFRKVQMGLGGAVLATAAVVGLLAVSASHGVTSAQQDLDTATAQKSAVQAETAKYSNVTAIYQAADAAQAQLYTAMGDEIRFSQLLSDLSLSIPSNVWLQTLSFSAAAPTGPAATATATATPTVGSLTVSGTGFSHDDVAVWLESIAGLKTYSSPYFSTSTESLLGTKPIVKFSATANLTTKAQSGRYKQTGGS